MGKSQMLNSQNVKKSKCQKVKTPKSQNAKRSNARSKIVYKSKGQEVIGKKLKLQVVKRTKGKMSKSQMIRKPNSNTQNAKRSKWIKAKC